MKKSYSLPFETPQFFCYHHLMCANAIIRANAKEKTQILFSPRHINCYFEEKSAQNKFVISTYDCWCTKENFLQRQLLGYLKCFCKTEKIDLVDIIKKCLLSNTYVFGQCGRKYIEQSDNYKSSTCNFVITGFDDASRKFTVYIIDLSDKFACYEIDYEQFVDALYDTSMLNINLALWRCNEKAVVSLDLPNILSELEDYLNSTSRKNNVEDKIYGLDAIKRLLQYFCLNAQNGEDIFEEYLNKFAMHKYYMSDRVECLISHNVVAQQWLSYAESVERLAFEALELGKKFNKTYNVELVNELKQKILETIDIEIKYLPNVLKEAKCFYDKYNVS